MWIVVLVLALLVLTAQTALLLLLPGLQAGHDADVQPTGPER